MRSRLRTLTFLLSLPTLAQAPMPPPTAAPAATAAPFLVKVDLVLNPSNREAIQLDRGLLKTDLDALLEMNGVRQIEEGARGGEALTLTVAPATLKEPSGICFYSVYANLDRPGRKALSTNVVVARPDAKGMELEIRNVVVDAVVALVRAHAKETGLIPAPPEKKAEPAKKNQLPPEWIDPKSVDFDFSMIKVKSQPPQPPYPPAAKASHTEGTVVVSITVDPEGNPTKATLKSGPRDLAMGALEYAMRWRFEPAKLNGKPQYARFQLKLVYRLDDMPGIPGIRPNMPRR